MGEYGNILMKGQSPAATGSRFPYFSRLLFVHRKKGTLRLFPQRPLYRFKTDEGYFFATF